VRKKSAPRGPYRKKAPSRAAHLPKPKKGERTPGAGRKKGTPNKFTRDIKEALIEAANRAGGSEGMAGYFLNQAEQNARSFMSLIGRAMPMAVEVSGSITLEALVLEAARKREERDAAAKKQG